MPDVPQRRVPPETRSDGLDPAALFGGAMAMSSGSRPERWTPPSAEEVQRLLPGYQIGECLGRGGMGAVFKALQCDLDRAVAIKLLQAELAEDPAFISRFRAEARLLARLDHPGIVRVHDFGQTTEGYLYFVMEYVVGPDLQRLIHGDGLPADQALGIAVQVCDALDHAHRIRIVHRDIEPANILITPDGRAKLADFGLARPLETDAARLTLSRVVGPTERLRTPESSARDLGARRDLHLRDSLLHQRGGGSSGKCLDPQRLVGAPELHFPAQRRGARCDAAGRPGVDERRGRQSFLPGLPEIR